MLPFFASRRGGGALRCVVVLVVSLIFPTKHREREQERARVGGDGRVEKLTTKRGSFPHQTFLLLLRLRLLLLLLRLNDAQRWGRAVVQYKFLNCTPTPPPFLICVPLSHFRVSTLFLSLSSFLSRTHVRPQHKSGSAEWARRPLASISLARALSRDSCSPVVGDGSRGGPGEGRDCFASYALPWTA